MKIPFTKKPPILSLRNGSRGQRGSAVLIVVVLIGCIALLLYANSRTLYLLKEDLKLLNMKQHARYGQTSRH